jgi:hypothetical protein
MLSIEPRLIRAPNMSLSSDIVARRESNITASITTAARNLGPNAPRSTSCGSSARVCVWHPGQQTFNNRCSTVTTVNAIGQLDDLVTDRPADQTLITRELTPAHATPRGAILDRLVRIINQIAREALMPRLAALLTTRSLPRRPFRRLPAITRRRQRAIHRVHPSRRSNLSSRASCSATRSNIASACSSAA